MLRIAIINECSVATDKSIQAMIPAFAQQWNGDLQAVWGVEAATFAFAPKAEAPVAGDWWVVFLDDSKQAHGLAYHDLTNDGLPIVKVFVQSIVAAQASLSVAASHEICEMGADPWLNSAYQDPHGTFWAGEICDPVEADRYGYEIAGCLMTDFVTPNWFAHQHAQGHVDLKGHAHTPFAVLSGGYAQKFDHANGWQQVTGATAARSERAKPAIGSRRERRARQWRSKLELSQVVWKKRR